MALATNGDKTGDKTKISEKNKKNIEAIKNFKEENGLSWSYIANEIYDKIEEDEKLEKEYLSVMTDDEEDVRRKFSDALENAIKRNQKRTTLNYKKITLEKICTILGLTNKKELEHKELEHKELEHKELEHKEIYIQVNTDVLYELPIPWEEWFIPKALKEVELAVEQGYPEAQTILAHFYYYHGKNGIRNVKKALDLYHSAAEQGYRFALYQLGLMYEYGDKDGDIVPNKDKSYKFYKGSADQDFPLALNKLAYYYYSYSDFSKFFEYSKKAQEQKDVIGSFYLAYAYQEGLGTSKNIEESISLYTDLLGNDDAKPYRMEIQWTLSKLHQTLGDEYNKKEAKRHFDTLIKDWTKMMIEAWKTEKINTITQLFNINPNRYNNILAAAHYDYVHNPQKLTVISAFTES